MNGPMPGFGDAATFGPFVRDPADYRGGPDDDAYTTAGLLHEVNRLIAAPEMAPRWDQLGFQEMPIKTAAQYCGTQLQAQAGQPEDVPRRLQQKGHGSAPAMAASLIELGLV